MNDPNKYLSSAGRTIICDGGEGGDGEGEGDGEPSLKDIKESIDGATDRMDDIHDTVKSVEDTQENLQEKVNSNEEAIAELREKFSEEGEGEGSEADGGDGEGEEGESEKGDSLTAEDVREIVQEETASIEEATEDASEKAVAKAFGLDPDELPEDEEERVEVLRKAKHETSRPNEDGDTNPVGKRSESGEVVMDEEAIELDL